MTYFYNTETCNVIFCILDIISHISLEKGGQIHYTDFICLVHTTVINDSRIRRSIGS